jgi:hypothetical protein
MSFTDGSVIALAGFACALVAVDGADAGEVTDRAQVIVPAAAAVAIDLPAGEFRITGTTGDELQAEVSIVCDGECPSRVGEAAFALEEAPGRVSLSMSPASTSAYRNLEVIYTVRVPRDHDVDLVLGAGLAEVTGLRGCVTGRMMAGEWRLELPVWPVRSVQLRTHVGDAYLDVPGAGGEGERALLVGAKVDWAEGTGECDVRLRLRFGDLRLTLVEDGERT